MGHCWVGRKPRIDPCSDGFGNSQTNIAFNKYSATASFTQGSSHQKLIDHLMNYDLLWFVNCMYIWSSASPITYCPPLSRQICLNVHCKAAGQNAAEKGLMILDASCWKEDSTSTTWIQLRCLENPAFLKAYMPISLLILLYWDLGTALVSSADGDV